jgi:hypothetical protein
MARPRKSACNGARSNTTNQHDASEDLPGNTDNNARVSNDSQQQNEHHQNQVEPQGIPTGTIPEEHVAPTIPVPLSDAQEKFRQIAMLLKSLSPEELLVLEQVPQNVRTTRANPAQRKPRQNDQISQQADSPASERRSLHSPQQGNSKPSDDNIRRKADRRRPQRNESKEHTIIPVEDDAGEAIPNRARTMRFSKTEIEKMVQERLEQRLRSVQNPWPRTTELQESLAACSPFCREIKEAQSIGQVPGRLPRYDGTTDPDDYIFSFTNIMNLYSHSAEFTAKLMVTTLEGLALDWFAK